jgi:hypothetical protein
MAGDFNKVRAGAQPCKMPMFRGGPRWSPEIIMEEVGCWSTYYIDAYGHGESKMEFYRCHGGSRLMVDLVEAHVQGGTKMEP